MMLNATFKNITAISWLTVLLMKETEVTGQAIDLSQVNDKVYYIMLYRVHITKQQDSNSPR
jgi:hypothetical protein